MRGEQHDPLLAFEHETLINFCRRLLIMQGGYERPYYGGYKRILVRCDRTDNLESLMSQWRLARYGRAQFRSVRVRHA